MGTVDTQDNQAGGNDQLEDLFHQKHDAHHAEHGAHHHHHHHERPMTQEEAVRSLLMLGQVALGSQDYESAVQAYASVLKLEQNETALYNLASLYARGLAVRQDYAEAARLFRQAQLMGNERAGKLCGKCMYDYLCEDIGDKTSADLYAKMAVFVSRVYPDAEDQKAEVNNGLLAVAATLLDRGERAEATKVLRAATDFGNVE
ncbi:MAG: SEL1-like repeat protein [Atopobiaceae bacterium]|nr:SEL1-like repeat protein [Atopobiaceae bacterium]